MKKCYYCGSAELASKAMCAECLEVHRVKKRLIRAERLARGSCTRCDIAPLKSKTLCSECLYVLSVGNAARSDARRTSGKCRRCCDPAREGSTICEKCYEREKARLRTYSPRKSPPEGICTRCKIMRAPEGRKRCKGCLAEAEKYRKPRVPGRCLRCGVEVPIGTGRCDKCREKIRAYRAKKACSPRPVC